MQDNWSCTPATRDGVFKVLSPARLGRYMPAANLDPNLALRLYIWNGQLHEAFVLPCQFAEIGIRNAIAAAVSYRFRRGGWHLPGGPLENLLFAEGKRLLTTARDKAVAEHGAAATVDHSIANLPFGFWTTLTTRRFKQHFWSKGIRWSFPHAPASTTVEDLSTRLVAIRDWRNRMAHHYALFDKGPTAEHDNILTVVGWISPELRWLTAQVSRVSAVIAARPQPVPSLPASAPLPPSPERVPASAPATE